MKIALKRYMNTCKLRALNFHQKKGCTIYAIMKKKKISWLEIVAIKDLCVSWLYVFTSWYTWAVFCNCFPCVSVFNKAESSSYDKATVFDRIFCNKAGNASYFESLPCMGSCLYTIIVQYSCYLKYIIGY